MEVDDPWFDEIIKLIFGVCKASNRISLIFGSHGIQPLLEINETGLGDLRFRCQKRLVLLVLVRIRL
jgi:hypothetical protein